MCVDLSAVSPSQLREEFMVLESWKQQGTGLHFMERVVTTECTLGRCPGGGSEVDRGVQGGDSGLQGIRLLEELHPRGLGSRVLFDSTQTY